MRSASTTHGLRDLDWRPAILRRWNHDMVEASWMHVVAGRCSGGPALGSHPQRGPVGASPSPYRALGLARGARCVYCAYANYEGVPREETNHATRRRDRSCRARPDDRARPWIVRRWDPQILRCTRWGRRTFDGKCRPRCGTRRTRRRRAWVGASSRSRPKVGTAAAASAMRCRIGAPQLWQAHTVRGDDERLRVPGLPAVPEAARCPPPGGLGRSRLPCGIVRRIVET